MFRWHAILGLIVVVLHSLVPNGPAGAEDPRAPLAMFDDEFYRRDGALTKLGICLAVADDRDAEALLRSINADKGEPPKAYALADVLATASNGLRKESGFGILLTCAEIVRAWYALPASGAKDGRRVHGTIVVDLALDDGRRAPLAPVPLVRILTSPGLLPKASFGGIVIRNAVIDGTLVFHNVHLSMPLSLVQVTFEGGDYAKAVYGESEAVTDTALSIIHSKFEDHIQVADSKMCGHVRIIDSDLAETLVFEDVEQTFVGCEEPRGDDADRPSKAPFVKIEGSRFGQTLSIVQSTLGSLKMDGNDIDTFVSSRSDFGSSLQIWEHDIGSLQINCSALAAYVDLSYNHIDKDFFIYGREHANVTFKKGETCARWWRKNEKALGRKTTIVLESNKIGGGLGLKGLDGPSLTPLVSLKSNRVGNGSVIELPEANVEELPVTAKGRGPWKGVFDLKGSTYQGTVEINVGTTPPQAKPVSADGDYCTPVSSASEPPEHAVVDLTAARIRTLTWNLPFACDYRWIGYGLNYDLWLVGEAAKKSAGNPDADAQSILPTWRQTLQTHDAASLSAMSRYLSDNGSTVDSRNILLEAKRLNYAPRCSPDRWTPTCFLTNLTGETLPPPLPFDLSAKASEIGSLDEMEPVALISPWQWLEELGTWLVTWVGGAITLFLLWPGGFGAAPDRAIMWILVSVFGCCAVYMIYARNLRTALTEIDSPRKALARCKENAPDEVAALIESLWEGSPDEHEWSRMGPDSRLRSLNALTKDMLTNEDKLQGLVLNDMRNLRRQFERFGNTERVGFSLFDLGKEPVRFSYLRYSVDAMLPFIDLHAYNYYYPVEPWVRMVSVVQHVCGWWWLTVFIASAAIL